MPVVLAGTTKWCALGLAPCLTAGEWTGAWSGLIGGFGATVAAIAYESWRRRQETRALLRSLKTSLADLRAKLVYFDDESALQLGEPIAPSTESLEVWRAIVATRSLLRVAIRHPGLRNDLRAAIDLLLAHFNEEERRIDEALRMLRQSVKAPPPRETYWFNRLVKAPLGDVLSRI